MPNSGELDFRMLLEKLPGLYWVFDPEFRIVAATDEVLKAGMRTREEVIGRRIVEAFPDNPDDPDASGVANLTASLERVRKTLAPDPMPVQQYDVERPAQDGGGYEVRYWSVINCPLLDRNGELLYIYQRAEEVTEYVQLRQRGSEQEELAGELRERAEKMQAEILQRSAELRELNERLHSASDAKNEFLSRMSHELRTPLASIMGFSELLSFADLDEEKHEWATSILRAGRHLLDLVNEVLDISRLEAGEFPMSIESIAVGPMLEEAIELVHPLAESADVTIHPPQIVAGSGYAKVDKQRLKQVVINLLSNAIKYNRASGEVRLTVEALDDDFLRILVADTGGGIDETSIAKLFTPFERLEAAGSEVEGTGLGLALSRTLIEAMGGSIDVDSERGVGTTFRVEVPRGEPTAVAVSEKEKRMLLSERTYSRERVVLYVEDTVANVRLLEEILRTRPSIHLLPAMMGTLGLELAREHRPDLILLDLHLPDLRGDHVLAQLRDDDRTRDIPVVMLTADATKRTGESLLEAGASAYLTKPIGVRDLLATLDEYLDG